MKEISAIVMLTIAMLCASAMAESMSVNQTGISGNISERNPFQDVVQGYDHALQLDPGNASAWLARPRYLKFWEIRLNLGNISRRLSMRPMGP